jgi:hypothetical protein
MTDAEIKSKLPKPLTGPRILPDVIECDHIIGISSNGIIMCISDKSALAKYGGIGFTYCPICGVKLEGL